MSTPDDAIGERAARALRALVETYAFDVADALAVVKTLPSSEDGDDASDLKRCVDELIDARGCVDRGGPALGMTRACAHCAGVDARRVEACERCARCGTGRELWRCLTCGECACGRYANGHSMAHARASGGKCVVTMSWDDLSVWCHECESYVDPACSAALGACVAAAERAKFGDAAASSGGG